MGHEIRIRVERVLVAAAFAAVGLFATAASPANAPIAKRHMIAAANPYAAEAGLTILRAGGSAVDAAIAAQMVLTLVEPQASGIGGGAFIMVAEPTGPMHAYDGRETAPASANPRMFVDADGKPRRLMDAVPGGLSVGVPGNIAVLAKAYAAHGKLPWARLFDPAIWLAERGFAVPRRLALGLREPGLADMPDMRRLFFHADGTPAAQGETWRNPQLAETFRLIAQTGPDAFYKGSVARQIVNAVTLAPRNPAVMTLDDLAGYRAKERTPLCEFYRAYRVCTMPPPGGGVVMLQILALVERFPSRELKPGTLSQVHRTSQAMRLAYADRTRWLGDPDFVPVPTRGLLDRAYVASRSMLIDTTRDMGTAAPGNPPVRGAVLDYAPQRTPVRSGTSHLSVVDDRGMVVSMTTTVEGPFGARIAAGGFLLNNQLTDFSFEPAIGGRQVANAPAAGKRPLSAMSPTIIFGPDGKFFATIGSAGGRSIIAYVTQSIVALIDGREDMRRALSEPRYVNQNADTLLEKGTAIERLAPQLARMNHRVAFVELTSGTQGIRRVKGGYEGAGDPRRDGAALGD